MNLNSITRRYDSLTGEERFKLILAAGARGDDAERHRLAAAGNRITLEAQDHLPYAQAFMQLSALVFVELADHAATYLEGFHVAEILGADTSSSKVHEDEPIGANRFLDVALGHGYLLKTKAHGWELFCERMSVPPFTLVEKWPGFERLQSALKAAELAAYTSEGMLRWLNWMRTKEGEPLHIKIAFTVESAADSFEKAFRECVQWWGGRG